MRHFLFAHFHWLWASLHWCHSHGYYIHYSVAFLLVVSIGVIQTILTVTGGKLAIPPTLLRAQQRGKFLPFKIGGWLLVGLFVVVGILNDQNQYHSEQNASAATALTAAWGNESHEFFKKFPNGLPPVTASAKSQGDAEDYRRLYDRLKAIDQEAASLRSKVQYNSVVPIAPTVLVSSVPTEKPLSALSDAELRASALAFCGHLRKQDIYFLDSQEHMTRARSVMQQLEDLQFQRAHQISAANVDRSENEFVSKTQEYNDLLRKIIDEDVRKAQEYRQVLLSRLGSRAVPPTEFPTVKPEFSSVNQFLIATLNKIQNWAEMLPAN